MRIVYESSYKTKPVYGDTLMHWKYIKRERKNGRWVYYYNDSEYQSAKNNYNKAEKNLDEAQLSYAAAQSNVEVNERIAKENGNYIVTAKAVREHKIEAYDAARRYAQAGEKYVQAKKEYQRVKVSTLAPRTIAKGAVAVANILSKVGSIFKKKKK